MDNGRREMHTTKDGHVFFVSKNVFHDGRTWVGESRVELPSGGESVVVFDGLWHWSTALRMRRETRWHLRILRKGGLL